MLKKNMIALSLERLERAVLADKNRAIRLFEEHARGGKTIVADAFVKTIVSHGTIDVGLAAEVAKIARIGIRVQTKLRRPQEAAEYREVLDRCC